MNTPSFKLSVTQSCTQSWDKMIENREGRFCTSCSKTVVDFTFLTDEEVQNYFIQNKGNHTCGRFYSAQLDRITIHLPSYILKKKRLPYWQKFLIILLVCFGNAILPVEIAGYHSNGVYAQGTVIHGAKKSKKKKYRQRKYKINLKTNYFPIDGPFTITMGLFVTPPATPIMELESPRVSIFKKTDTNKKSSKIQHRNSSNKNSEHEDQSSSGQSHNATAALLPMSLSFSSKRKKRKP